MVLLENDQFMTELTRFYQKAKGAGTVVVTMKRYDGRTKPVSRNAKKSQPVPAEPMDYKCLIRASMGSKKLSTVISHKDLNKFQLAYSNLIRGNIELKKKGTSSKTKKAKSKKSEKPVEKMDTQ